MVHDFLENPSCVVRGSSAGFLLRTCDLIFVESWKPKNNANNANRRTRCTSLVPTIFYRSFFDRLLEAGWKPLGSLLVCLGLWPDVLELMQKPIPNACFQTGVFSQPCVSWAAFGSNTGSFWRVLGPEMESQIQRKMVPWLLLPIVGRLFGAVLGPMSSPKPTPKVD